MKQERKICFRITTWRIAVTVLVAASIVNLAIVGAVTAVASSPPTATSTITLPPSVTAQEVEITATYTDTSAFTATSTFTETVTITPTATLTPTNTSTLPVSLTPCSPQYGWPIYTVQHGDTLFSIARATGATVSELKAANCLTDDLIFAGQLLYVPHLPVTPTFTPTFTPSVTVTITTPAPTDTPTDFQKPDAISCDRYLVDFSVTASDPQGITSVTVLVYGSEQKLLEQLSMKPDGNRYTASTSSQTYSVADIVFYYFNAIDTFGNPTATQAYDSSSIYCPLG